MWFKCKVTHAITAYNCASKIKANPEAKRRCHTSINSAKDQKKKKLIIMNLTLFLIVTVGLCVVGCAEINSDEYTTSSTMSAMPIDESVLLLQMHLCRDVCYKEVKVLFFML